MKAITHPVPFSNDCDDRVMRSGQGLPSQPARSTMNTYEPGLEDREGHRLARWESSSSKKAKPDYNDEAQLAAATIAASPQTKAIRETAKDTAEDVRVRQALGQPNGYSRSDEVLVETDSYRITRSSDGTIRNDLHNRPDLKAPGVKMPTQPSGASPSSTGKTLTQEEIDNL